MRFRLIVLGIALVLVAAGLGLSTLLQGGSGTPPPPAPGVVSTSSPLPEAVSGSTIDGGSFSPATYAGKVLVLNFWNPYCAPCRAEASVLDVAEGRLGSKGVVIAGVLFSNISFPHDVDAARRFAHDLGERYPTIDDADGSIATAFAVRGIPTTIVADATGRVRLEVFGALKAGELERLVRRVRTTR